MIDYDWLPELVEFPGNWNEFDEYTETVHEVFLETLVNNGAGVVDGHKVTLRRHPVFQGKHESFWHLVTEGTDPNARTPVVPRCERIGWPRAIIDRASTQRDIPMWRLATPASRRLIALPDFSYVVVLDERQGTHERFYLLLTAYPVDRPHYRRKLERQWLDGKIYP